jgi:hypothetical protein
VVEILATVVTDNRAFPLVRALELIQTHFRFVELVRVFEYAPKSAFQSDLAAHTHYAVW